MDFELEYNTDREHLIIPEYGRHIQKIINHCKTLESKEERNTMALAIIDVMGNLQPHLRDVPDFKHKLWDQLFIMSNFELDVDAPYDKLTKEVLLEKPERLAYPKSSSKYRFYGNNIQTMIDVANSWEDNEMKDLLILTIANHMKKCYLIWNKDTVDDAVILAHLKELSKGKLLLPENTELSNDIPTDSKQKKTFTKSKKHYSKKPRN